MKATRITATPTKAFPTHSCGLEIRQHKKMLKMKSALDSLLKTKGQKSAPDEFMKTKGFSTFLDYSMIRKALVAIFTDSVLNKWPAPFEF
jgi:hypothetical protein